MFRGVAFFCTLIAAVVGAPERSHAPFSVRSVSRPQFVDAVGDSLPADTVYSPLTVNTYPLALSILDVSLGSASSLEDCRSQAATKGGQIFEYNSDTGRCNVASIQFPVCDSEAGTVDIYVLPEYITSGTSDDGTTVEPLTKGVLLWSVLDEPAAEYGSFRVDDPVILDYPEYFNADSASSVQTIFTAADSSQVQIDSDIVVSHACRTNSSCGVPFVYPIPNRKIRIIPLSDYCNSGTIRVAPDEVVYLVSHDEFGCALFPDAGYGLDSCRVQYRGRDDYNPLKFTLHYFNFIGNDQCDGFYLSILAQHYGGGNTPWNIYLPCDGSPPPTEIIAERPRGRIDFSGVAITGRPKIGFVFKLSY